MLELVQALQDKRSLATVPGIIYKTQNQVKHTAPRGFIKNLDTLPFPTRDSLDNNAYKNYYKKRYGYTTTSIMTSRGCPFQCDFCSRPVFGNQLRSRSASNIADEVEEVRKLGYDRIWFADDCFTINRNRLLSICKELKHRKIRIGWECLSRVDTVDTEIARNMKQAGCIRVYFGIESGNDKVLKIMRKQVTTQQARNAVKTFRNIGIQTGAFFILGYPGETEQTVLDTANFASSLPLDYLSFTFPYPIPGTPLHERVKTQLTCDDWSEPNGPHLVKHKLMFHSDFSENKLKLALFKGMIQHYTKKYLGKRSYNLIRKPLEKTTEALFKATP
jgi:anaerobic magnesium-protoporphyrin IX monomethyl ester cyclase